MDVPIDVRYAFRFEGQVVMEGGAPAGSGRVLLYQKMESGDLRMIAVGEIASAGAYGFSSSLRHGTRLVLQPDPAFFDAEPCALAIESCTVPRRIQRDFIAKAQAYIAIEGTVIGPDAKPLACATVELVLSRTGKLTNGSDYRSSVRSRKTTDPEGRFRLLVYLPGDGELIISHESFASTRLALGGLMIGDRRTDLVVQLKQARSWRTCEGKVLGSDGNPIASAEVTFIRNGGDPHAPVFLTTTTDSKGAFTAKLDPGARYEVRVRAEDHEEASFNLDDVPGAVFVLRKE